MWPFDQLRRLFGGGPPSPKPGSASSLEDKLAEFVNQEDQRAAAPAQAREKTGSREMIDAARRTVETIQGAFRSYVEDKVLRRFGTDFKLETPTPAQTRDIDLKFGDAKTGNEYRYVRVSFKDRFAIVVRAQAMILSRDVQIKTLFMEQRGEAPHLVQEIDLSSWSSLAEIDWGTVYDEVFLEFLSWHKATVAKQG